MRRSVSSDMTKDGFKAGGEVEKNLSNLSAGEKRKYLFLKQIATLNSFRERNAISKEQYKMSYNGLATKMEITERELKEWLNAFE